MSEGIKGVGLSGVMADMPRPMLEMSTRGNFLNKYLGSYKQMIRYRFYALVGVLLGAYLLFVIPIVAMVVLFLATYFYEQHLVQKDRTLKSTRTVMLGH